MAGYGEYQKQQKPSGLDYASFGLNVLGTGLGAIGAFNQSDSAEKQYELAVRAFEADQERQRREAEERRQQQLYNNIMTGGGYAQGMVKNAQDAYGSYARRAGL